MKIKLNDKGNSSDTSSGIGFFGLLGIVFIVLKLCGVIDWPWIWVLSPIWVSIVIGIALIIISFVLMYIFNKRW